MAKRLYTEADVRALPRGAELVLGPDALATPAALDLAHERGVHVSYASKAAAGASGASTASAVSASVWHKLLQQDGSYVVEVRGGRAQVWQLTPNGPLAFGSERTEIKH